MNASLHITVTSVPGHPVLVTDGAATPEQIRRLVLKQHGLQTDGISPGIAHSYCGKLVPPCEAARREPPSSRVPSLISQRGHLRAI